MEGIERKLICTCNSLFARCVHKGSTANTLVPAANIQCHIQASAHSRVSAYAYVLHFKGSVNVHVAVSILMYRVYANRTHAKNYNFNFRTNFWKRLSYCSLLGRVSGDSINCLH